MHDIRTIRQDAKAFDDALSRRGIDPQSAIILEIDTKRRQLITSLQELQQRRNDASREIGTIKKSGGDASTIMEDCLLYTSPSPRD